MESHGEGLGMRLRPYSWQLTYTLLLRPLKVELGEHDEVRLQDSFLWSANVHVL